MTVRELIEKIQNLESDKEVILSSDEEGNMFGKCDWVAITDDRVTLYPGETVEAVSVPVCPVCDKAYIDPPALSRRDNKTKICPECGAKEALEDYINYKEQEAKRACNA